MLRAIAILGLAACAAPARRPVSHATAAQAAEPCPHDVERVARAAFRKPGGELSADCVALRSGGQTVWVLEGEWVPVPNPDYVHSDARAVVAPDGRVLWREVDDGINLDTDVLSGEGHAIDLDGDGTDEILRENSGVDKRGLQRRSLAVETVRGGALVGDEVMLAFDDHSREDPPSVCSSTYRLIDAPGGGKRIEVVTTVKNDNGDFCLSPGRHLFRWTGTALAELPATP